MRAHAEQNLPAEHSDATFSVEVITSLDDLDLLEPGWNRLSENATNPNAFMTFAWFRAWLQRRTQENPKGHLGPHVLVLSQQGEVAGVVPWVMRISKRLGLPIRRLEFVTNHSDYNDLVLGRAPGLIEVAVDHLAKTRTEWDAIYLRDLRASDEELARLDTALVRVCLPCRVRTEKDGCPYLTIDGDSESLTARLSGHVRRTLRGRMQRAAAEGMSIRIIENPHLDPNLIERLAALEQIKQVHKSADAFVGRYREVFQSLFDSLGPQGWLYVALMEQGERPVAFQLGFRCGNKIWDYSKAYDRSFARLAPGTLLLPAILNYAFANGFREYDFLRGEETYKKVWADKVHRRRQVLIWQPRMASRLRKLAYHDVGEWINELSHRKERGVG